MDRFRWGWRQVKEEERGVERQKRKQGRSYHDKDMYTEPLSIIEATAAAARAKLDYVKINNCLHNALHDIDNISEQQVSDIFQLLSWVASVVWTKDLMKRNGMTLASTTTELQVK